MYDWTDAIFSLVDIRLCILLLWLTSSRVVRTDEGGELRWRGFNWRLTTSMRNRGFPNIREFPGVCENGGCQFIGVWDLASTRMNILCINWSTVCLPPQFKHLYTKSTLPPVPSAPQQRALRLEKLLSMSEVVLQYNFNRTVNLVHVSI